MSKAKVLLSCLLGLTVCCQAEQVALKNGDRLTGAIVSMDGKKLVVNTSYAGDVSIDWGEVAQFSSDKPLVITCTDKQVLSGTVSTEGAERCYRDHTGVTDAGPGRRWRDAVAG